MDLDERLTRIEERLDALEGRNAAHERRQVAASERICEVLDEAAPAELNLRQVLVAVGLKGRGFRTTIVRSALAELVVAGVVLERSGARRARLFRSAPKE